MNKKLYFYFSILVRSKMERYYSYVAKIMRFETSQGFFLVFDAKCTKYLTFGTSARCPQHTENHPTKSYFIGLCNAILPMSHL